MNKIASIYKKRDRAHAMLLECDIALDKILKERQSQFLKDYIFWIKDWWAEDMPYGIKGLIKRLNKL